ncbi:MAG: hypothetical protein H7Y04_11135 [Verrucomicrobia bacterium]|nr:hypothetical protein [Cytophagales bacterium]
MEKQTPLVIDQAKDHFLGHFPQIMPIENAYTHIGMYLGWVVENELFSEFFREESELQIMRFKRQEISCIILSELWDGYLGTDLFNESGVAFTKDYYVGGKYAEDYKNNLAENLPSIYHVDDSWENYETMSKKLSERYQAWQKARIHS